VAPGLLERIISPAILRARTDSRALGDADIQILPCSSAKFPLRTIRTIKSYTRFEKKAFHARKTKKIPTTIIITPRAVRAVTFSRNRKTLASVEKRGVVEDIGTARDCGISTKLYASKN
jgi:hypothetical protein